MKTDDTHHPTDHSSHTHTDKNKDKDKDKDKDNVDEMRNCQLIKPYIL